MCNVAGTWTPVLYVWFHIDSVIWVKPHFFFAVVNERFEVISQSFSLFLVFLSNSSDFYNHNNIVKAQFWYNNTINLFVYLYVCLFGKDERYLVRDRIWSQIWGKRDLPLMKPDVTNHGLIMSSTLDVFVYTCFLLFSPFIFLASILGKCLNGDGVGVWWRG